MCDKSLLMGEKLLFGCVTIVQRMGDNRPEEGVRGICVSFGSVFFQYNGVETSVCCHYIISILVYWGWMCGGWREELVRVELGIGVKEWRIGDGVFGG